MFYEMNGKTYHHKHLCVACGCRMGIHKAGTDANGPEGRCPETTSFGYAAPLRDLDDLDAANREYARYWGASKTIFTPKI
jgi:hypothetical protein